MVRSSSSSLFFSPQQKQRPHQSPSMKKIPRLWFQFVKEEVEFLILRTNSSGAVKILHKQLKHDHLAHDHDHDYNHDYHGGVFVDLLLHVCYFQLVFPVCEQFWRVLILREFFLEHFHFHHQ